MQADLELNYLIKLFKKIIENYINYFKDGDIKIYCSNTVKVAYEMASHDFSYNEFIMAIPYFQESYIHILLDNLSKNDIDMGITLSNRIYNKTVSVIRDEYFDIKDPTLNAILELSELRDDETGKHVERSREYAISLAQAANMDGNFIKNMNKASLLHDIGKVAIKDDILLKPGKLTEDEFEEMKKHTVIGARAISKVLSSNDVKNEYLYMAIDISYSHHEKYDGSGYPNGLKGIQIPISARIFSIADAYDVITSKRPYKEPLSHGDAVKRLISDSGKHFDPVIIDLFVKNQDKFKAINDKYKCLQQIERKDQKYLKSG